VPVNGKNIEVPLVNIGPITAGSGGTAASNLIETYTVQEIGGRGYGPQYLTNVSGGSKTFTKPTDNIGNKTFGDPAAYETYADQYIYNVNIPGCSSPGRIFVGQRKDPFVVNLGETFDLVNISNPVGSPTEAADALAGKNVTAIEMEVPSTCLLANPSEPIIGGWTTASVPAGRFQNASMNGSYQNKNGKNLVQVSRLGMPLVNELVIGITDKDRFNSSIPRNDAQFLQYVTNPSVPALIQALFPSVTAPTLFPRTDLVATFLTGIKGLNQPPYVVPAEIFGSTPVRRSRLSARKAVWVHLAETSPVIPTDAARAMMSWTLPCR
jgi:hypothetical protein